ncbi:hypothetical protein ABZ770_42845 [Streptomyces sp. NPDC006654]|uniref:hypothetical protein n=1 Tax=unclassified Streptomyces TaxID=2593676 RepID=UPI0033CF66F2
MHVVIAWWDKRRTTAAGTARPCPSGPAGSRPAGTRPAGTRPAAPAVGGALPSEFPGLRSGRWITDPTADLQGLALIWDSAASADLFLPALSERTFGCAPSHRWVFEVRDTASPDEDPEGLPGELELLLHA